ncbi:hypothetical protein BWL79_25575 [Salmonella enterica]|nr:hypothetical protein [Salmonella enterica]
MKGSVKKQRNIADFFNAGILNTLVIYIAISSYNYFLHGIDFFSSTTLLLSLGITLINYFIGNSYYYLSDKLKGIKNAKPQC